MPRKPTAAQIAARAERGRMREAAAKRLVRAADRMPAWAWAEGAKWYSSERRFIARHARANDVAIRHAIHAYAALSPRAQYARNREAFVALIRGDESGARSHVFGRNVDKAKRCLAGDMRALSGDKVTAFACNIDGCYECVTVDVWACRAAGCEHLFVKLGTNDNYRTIADAYRLAARRMGVPVSVMQAALWWAVRGEKPTDKRPVSRRENKNLQTSAD